MKATSAHFLQGRNLAWIAFTTTITVVSLIFFSPLSTFSARAEQPSEVSAELSDIKDWNSKSEEWLEEHPPLQEPVVSRLLTGIKGQLEQNPELVAGGEGWALGEDSPTAYEIDNGFLLSVPVTGNNVVRGSFVAFSLDQDGIISSVNQIILQDIGASDRGRMTVYRDGKMTKDVIVIQADDTEIQLPEGTKSITTGIKVASIMATGVLHQMAFIPKAGWSWKKFNSCLANMGVAAWTVTAISIACGFACPSTGPGCLLCLVGAAYVTQGTVTYCFGKALT